jgi:hypothetical protein
MTVSRMLMAAFVALAAGIAVEKAKATSSCPGAKCVTVAAGHTATR